MSLPRRVLVTGGGTGIGRGIVAALSAAGAAVVLCGRREAVVSQAARELGVDGVVGDVTADPDALLDAAGPVDGLVHNAGSLVRGPVGSWSPADWDQMWAVHVRGPALLSQAFARRLEGPGALVAVSSTLAVRTAPASAAYSAAKAAQLSLIRSLAVELAPRGIRANAVLAGVVPTAMTTARRGAATVDAQLEALRQLHPLGRLGQPGEVGQVVVSLLSNAWVTGAEVAVDGGLLVG